MPDTKKISTTDLDAIARSKSLEPEVLEVYTELKRFKDDPARTAWLNRRKEAWAAIENDMTEGAVKAEMSEKRQKDTPVNKCVKGVQGSAAIVTDQNPELKFSPIGSGDLYVSELLKRAHDVVWEKNEGIDETYNFVEEAKIGAIGVIDSSHDPSKGPFGRVVFSEGDPTNYYWDSESKKRDRSDSHIIKAVQRTKKYLLDHYEDISEDDLEYEVTLGDPEKSSGLEGKDNYTEPPDDTEVPGDSDENKKTAWEIEAWMLKTLKEWIVTSETEQGMVVKTFSSKAEAKEAFPEIKDEDIIFRPREIREQRIIVGKKLINAEVNPNGVDADGDPVISSVILPHQRTRKAYNMSPTNYALPINRDKNKRRSQFHFGVAQTANSPIVRPKASKWSGPPGDPGSELIVDKNITFQPYRLQSGAMAMDLYLKAEDRDDSDIDDQYDLQDVMKGKMDGKMAWQTVYALQEFGGMMSKPFLRALESALVRLGKINISLILRHWTRDMWERLIEPEELGTWEPDIERVKREAEEQDPVAEEIEKKWQNALELVSPSDRTKKDPISLVDIDVKITAGSSMPTNRMAKLQVAMEMTQAGIYDAEAALEYVDDPNKDKIVARRKQQEAEMAQAEMMKGVK